MPIGLPPESTIAASSPGANADSGVRATSTSLLNTHEWPARRRASSLRLSMSAGYSTPSSSLVSSMGGTVAQAPEMGNRE